ncbi:unnamed protein product [Rhizopus stolonifer]
MFQLFRNSRLAFQQNKIHGYQKTRTLRSLDTRSFHVNRPLQIPIVPLPAFLLALKTGQFVTHVSALSRLSLTLLSGMKMRKGKIPKTISKVIAFVPIFGVLSLFALGLDEAPHTSRVRLVYLDKEEQEVMVKQTMDSILESYPGLVDPEDSSMVQWLQIIVNDLASVAVDDIRDPVRRYWSNKRQDKDLPPTDPSNDTNIMAENDREPPEKSYKVHYVRDGLTVNAVCVGSHFVVYDAMAVFTEFDEEKMAAILGHEMAHSLQDHFVEKYGFLALTSTVGDLTRAVLWPVTGTLGPYFNDKINEFVDWCNTLLCEKSYSRQLEKEADLIGLKIMAKAGYNPKFAIEFWLSMLELEKIVEESVAEVMKEEKEKIDEDWMASPDTWFGETHPPTEERIHYLLEHLEEATDIYEESIRLNGHPYLVVRAKMIKEQKAQEKKEQEMKEEHEKEKRVVMSQGEKEEVAIILETKKIDLTLERKDEMNLLLKNSPRVLE